MTRPEENEKLIVLRNEHDDLLRRRVELEEELQLYERLLHSALYYIRRRRKKRLLLHSSVRLGSVISPFPTEEQIRTALAAYYICRVQIREVLNSIEWEIHLATAGPPRPPTQWEKFWDDYKGHIGCLLYITSPIWLAFVFGGLAIAFDWLV